MGKDKYICFRMEKCVPDYCKNGGKCVETNSKPVCDCSQTSKRGNFFIKRCEPLLRKIQNKKQNGENIRREKCM